MPSEAQRRAPAEGMPEAETKRRGLARDRLAAKPAEAGVGETAAGIRDEAGRGGSSAAFLARRPRATGRHALGPDDARSRPWTPSGRRRRGRRTPGRRARASRGRRRAAVAPGRPRPRRARGRPVLPAVAEGRTPHPNAGHAPAAVHGALDLAG
jgi:hypothetical protein